MNKENEQDYKYEKMVYKILKKLGHKVHWYYIENDEPKFVEKPDDEVVAYDDAMRKYDGINNFMCWDSAKFIDKNSFENIANNYYKK